MSPLRIPPLPRMGRWAARAVHGNRRSSEGHLLTARHFIDDDQEWRLGQAYLGILGLPFNIVAIAYMQLGHCPKTGFNGRCRLGHWSDLPLDLQILAPTIFVVQLIMLASIARAVLLWQQIGLREEIGQ